MEREGPLVAVSEAGCIVWERPVRRDKGFVVDAIAMSTSYASIVPPVCMVCSTEHMAPVHTCYLTSEALQQKHYGKLQMEKI